MSDDFWRKEAKSEQKFVNFKALGNFTGVFVHAEYFDGKFGRVMRYKFKDDEGNEKIFDSGSKRLKGLMASVPYGVKVKLFRHGEGYETHYELEVLSKPTVDNLVKNKEEVSTKEAPTKAWLEPEGWES